MKEIVEKLRSLEDIISKEKGEFDFFALFLREDSFNKWDILAASNWINENREVALKHLAKKVQDTLSKNEIVQISKIVLIEENNPGLSAIQKAIHIEHGITEIKDSNFFGLDIKHAYLITSGNKQVA